MPGLGERPQVSTVGSSKRRGSGHDTLRIRNHVHPSEQHAHMRFICWNLDRVTCIIGPAKMEGGRPMQRRRVKQTTSLDERLAEQARQIRTSAEALPQGSKERDDMMRKARQADTACHMNEWLTSAGLQPPK